MSDVRIGSWAFIFLSVFTLAYYPGYEFGRGGNLSNILSSGWPLIPANIMPVIFFAIAIYYFREANEGNAWMSWSFVAAIGVAGIAGFGLGSFLGWTTIK